jgi:hypothetical protein
MNATFFTNDQLNALVASAKTKAQIQQFIVIVDGQMHTFKNTRGFRKLLEGCLIPKNCQPFRNAMGGATVNLDS